MRELVLDTESTGLDPHNGHRVVEIGAVELVHKIPTGNTYHCYINPQRNMPADAFQVHGLSEGFLSQYPPFEDIVEEFLAYVGKDLMIIHNAPFDLGFLNAELARLGRGGFPETQVVDTLPLARRLLPGGRHSLDALCQRFQIDNGHRDIHGALLDAELLAAVYIELCGGRQPGLMADDTAEEPGAQEVATEAAATAPRREPRPFEASSEERARHADFLKRLSDPLWAA